MRQLGLLLIFSFLLLINCWAQAKITKHPHQTQEVKEVQKNNESHKSDQDWKDKMKGLHGKMNGSKVPDVLKCVHYSKHICWANETYCSNLLEGGSCSCIVNQPYKVIKLNEPKKVITCPIGWNSTPNWILFFAFIGFAVFLFFVFQCIRYFWPTISSNAKPAVTKAKTFITRQWQQTQYSPPPASYLMQSFNQQENNSSFTLDDDSAGPSNRENIVY